MKPTISSSLVLLFISHILLALSNPVPDFSAANPQATPTPNPSPPSPPATTRKFTYTLTTHLLSFPLATYKTFIAHELTIALNAMALFGRDALLPHNTYHDYSSPSSSDAVSIFIEFGGTSAKPLTWGVLADALADMAKDGAWWERYVRDGMVPSFRVEVTDVLEGGREVRAANGILGSLGEGVGVGVGVGGNRTGAF